MDDSAEEPCDPATSTRTSCPIGLRTDSIPTNPEFESSYRNQRPFILAAALTDWPAVHLWSSDQHLRTLPASSAVRCLYAHDNTNFLKNILTTAEDLDMAHAVNDVLEQPTGRRAYLRTNLANFEGSLQQEVDVGAILRYNRLAQLQRRSRHRTVGCGSRAQVVSHRFTSTFVTGSYVS